jgi:hypothetical protein
MLAWKKWPSFARNELIKPESGSLKKAAPTVRPPGYKRRLRKLLNCYS